MRILALFLAAVSCAGVEKAQMQGDGSPGGADLDPNSNQLRIDIYPGSGSADLQPQSWIADGDADWDSVAIDIKPSVTVSGQILGYTVNPLHAEVPGADRSPVAATVTVSRPGTISGGAVVTDENGDFSIKVPPARDYTISIVPNDDLLLPFQVVQGVDITDGLDLEEVDLGYGSPVYGQITNDVGSPIENAEVRLRHLASGTNGPRTLTDSRGHYLLRAVPDEYQLLISGTIGVPLPSINVPASLIAEDGLMVDVDIGAVDAIPVAGQLTAAEGGRAVRNVKVRLSSDRLHSTDGHLVIETETDGDGLFSRRLLPGTWLGEFIPEYDGNLGSVEMSFSVAPDNSTVDLGRLALPDRIPFTSTVIDPEGNVVEGAAINAHEMGFDSYIFSTTTDTLGSFTLYVPPHPISVAVTPASTDWAVTRKIVNPGEGLSSITMSEGDLLSGSVFSEGTGLEFALIEIRNMAGDLFATTITDPSGGFAVRVDGF